MRIMKETKMGINKEFALILLEEIFQQIILEHPCFANQEALTSTLFRNGHR